MTEIYRKYRLTSSEEPTDDMLHALMEDVVVEAIKSSKRAEAVKGKIGLLSPNSQSLFGRST